MARAVKQVERLRLEMQRAEERIHSRDDIPEDGTIVHRKKKKARVAPVGNVSHASDARGVVPDQPQEVVVKKKKKRREDGISDTASARRIDGDLEEASVTAGATKKKKKKRQIALEGT